MENATSKYVLGVARAPGTCQFPTTDHQPCGFLPSGRQSRSWPDTTASLGSNPTKQSPAENRKIDELLKLPQRSCGKSLW